MKLSSFKTWLSENYSPNSAATHLSCAKRVEEQYGDLDQHFENGTIDDIIGALQYSKADEKAGKANPTKMTVSGNPYNVLNNYKSAIRCYKIFLEEGGEESTIADAAIEAAGQILKEKKDGKLFELERHLQEGVRAEISQLETGLSIIDGGGERVVASGSIDILAQDENGALVVIELKKGIASREAVGQIAGYMGDLMSEEPGTAVRGILVAADFHKSCRSGVRAIPGLSLKRYRFAFTFDSPT